MRRKEKGRGKREELEGNKGGEPLICLHMPRNRILGVVKREKGFFENRLFHLLFFLSLGQFLHRFCLILEPPFLPDFVFTVKNSQTLNHTEPHHNHSSNTTQTQHTTHHPTHNTTKGPTSTAFVNVQRSK